MQKMGGSKLSFTGFTNFFRKIVNLGNTPSSSDMTKSGYFPMDLTDLRKKIKELEDLFDQRPPVRPIKENVTPARNTLIYTALTDSPSPYRCPPNNKNQLSYPANSSTTCFKDDIHQQPCLRESDYFIDLDEKKNEQYLKMYFSETPNYWPFSYFKKKKIANRHSLRKNETNLITHNQPEQLPAEISINDELSSLMCCEDSDNTTSQSHDTHECPRQHHHFCNQDASEESTLHATHHCDYDEAIHRAHSVFIYTSLHDMVRMKNSKKNYMNGDDVCRREDQFVPRRDVYENYWVQPQYSISNKKKKTKVQSTQQNTCEVQPAQTATSEMVTHRNAACFTVTMNDTECQTAKSIDARPVPPPASKEFKTVATLNQAQSIAISKTLMYKNAASHTIRKDNECQTVTSHHLQPMATKEDILYKVQQAQTTTPKSSTHKNAANVTTTTNDTECQTLSSHNSRQVLPMATKEEKTKATLYHVQQAQIATQKSLIRKNAENKTTTTNNNECQTVASEHTEPELTAKQDRIESSLNQIKTILQDLLVEIRANTQIKYVNNDSHKYFPTCCHAQTNPYDTSGSVPPHSLIITPVMMNDPSGPCNTEQQHCWSF